MGLVLSFALFAGAYAPEAAADISHVVQRGHTIEAIAHRYHVPVKTILDANHLTDATHLVPGQVLVIPGVDPKKPETVKKKTDREGDREKLARAALSRGPSPDTSAAPGPAEAKDSSRTYTIHAVRLGEDFHIRVSDGHGHVPAGALKAFERLMRQGNAGHEPDPRLVALVGIVSRHFGNPTIEVVSGYRGYAPAQFTPHSNHNFGKAIDFRLRGVSNEALRDFCRTLRNAGCGYYPNSTFVHLDVRESKAYWVDLSRPGEPPRYEKGSAGADEDTSDVPNDSQAVGDSAEGPSAPDAAADSASRALPPLPPP